eukprot:329107-Chlamydomonas_euryale.AAC.14
MSYKLWPVLYITALHTKCMHALRNNYPAQYVPWPAPISSEVDDRLRPGTCTRVREKPNTPDVRASKLPFSSCADVPCNVPLYRPTWTSPTCAYPIRRPT